MNTPRPSWPGSIRIGTQEFGISLFPATTDGDDIALTTLHATDSGELKSHRVCSKCTKTVGPTETITAVATPDGHLVLSKDDLAGLAPISRKVLVIREFIGIHQVPLVHFEKPYIVRPSDDGDRLYASFVDALRRTGLAGVGKISFRSRERLAVVAVVDGDLMLYTLRFSDEIRPSELPASHAEDAYNSNDYAIFDEMVDLQVEQMLILSTPNPFPTWSPARYSDDYNAGLRRLIDGKKGKPRTAPGPEALKRSVASVKKTQIRATGASRASGHPESTAVRTRRDA